MATGNIGSNSLPALSGTSATGAQVSAAATTAPPASLPTLGTSASSAQAVPGGTGTAPTQDAAAGGMPAGGFNPATAMPAMRWIGPLMAIGGVALAMRGVKTGSTMARWGGAATVVSGVAATALGWQAQGAKKVQDQVVPLMSQVNQQLASDQQVIAAYQQALVNAGIDPTTGKPTGQQTGSTPTNPGQGTGTTPGQGSGVPTTPGQAATPTAAPVLADAQWTPAAIVGSAIQLPAAASGVTNVAEAGSFTLASQLGAPDGYASFAEADAAARSGISDQVFNTKSMRWVVIQHGSKFYAYEAHLDESKAAPAMPAQNGTVAGWHALRMVNTGAGYEWMQVDASASGAQVAPYQRSGSAPTQGSGTSSSTGQVSAGGPAGSPDMQRQIGRVFHVDDAAGSGVTATGGWIQLQGLVGSAAVTPEDAASSARVARLKDGNASPWARYAVVRGSDGLWYTFRASVVARPTQELDAGVQPALVFGSGFSEFFDGSAWRAQVD